MGEEYENLPRFIPYFMAERKLAEHLGVSRSQIREAIRKLEHHGSDVKNTDAKNRRVTIILKEGEIERQVDQINSLKEKRGFHLKSPFLFLELGNRKVELFERFAFRFFELLKDWIIVPASPHTLPESSKTSLQPFFAVPQMHLQKHQGGVDLQ